MSDPEFKQKFSLPTCHSCPLMKNLHFYRATGKYIDVILNVGMHQYKTHRIVLSTSSPVLERQLSSQSSSMIHKPINIFLDKNVISFKIIEDLLNFFYTSTILLTSNNVYDVYRAAEHLEIDSLSQWCEEFFAENLRPDNAVLCFLTSKDYEIERFMSKAKTYMLTYISDSLESNLLGNIDFVQMQTRIELLLINLDHKKQSVRWTERVTELVIDLAEHFPVQSIVLSLLFRNLPIDKLSSRFLDGILSQAIISGSHPVSKFLNNFLRQRTDYNGLYCFSNDEENNSNYTVSYLPSIDSTCRTIQQRPLSSSFSGLAVARRHIYIAGGIENGVAVDSFQAFDCLTKRSTDLRPMPHSRVSCAAVAYNGFVYVSGGSDYFNGVPSSSMIKYNIATNEWESCASMTTPRSFHQLVELRGRLYAIGGINNALDSDNDLLNHLKFSKISLRKSKHLLTKWKLLRRSKSSISSNSVEVMSTVEVYDPETNHWKLIDDTNYSYWMFGAAVHKEKIYVCNHDSFEVYSTKSDSWKVLPNPSDIYDCRCLVSFEGQLLAIGGGSSTDSESSAMAYEPEFKQSRLSYIGLTGKLHSSVVVDF